MKHKFIHQTTSLISILTLLLAGTVTVSAEETGAKATSTRIRQEIQERKEEHKAEIKEKREELKENIKERREERKTKVSEAVKKRIERHAQKIIARTNAAIERVERLILRTEARIVKFETNGVVATTSKAHIATAKTELAAAKTDASGLPGALTAALSSTTPKTALDATFKPLTESVKDHLKKSHRALQMAVSSLKPGINKATTTATTTTNN